MEHRSTIEERYSSDVSNRERDIPSFIEPQPPLILNPFMRPRPQKGTNLLELFEEDDSIDEDAPELVQVYLRLKPSNVPSSLYEVRGDQCLITSVDTATAGHGRRTQHNVSKMYTFSHIFGPEANQKEIFERVVKGNLRKLPEGNSFTLLTYGASGSGKTYTLMGTVKAPGLVPRSLEYVFKVVEAAQMPLYRPGEVRANKLSLAEQDHELQWVRKLRHVSAPLRDKYRRMSTRLCGDMTRSTVDLSNRTKYYVWVSFVEIYNEAIYDLLVSTDRTAASKLRIREDPSGNVYVKGATQAFVRTGEEAYDVMVAGKHNLQVHATGVHAHSSRSHCIFTITMLTETESGVRASHVRLCDLAGSERARRTRNTGARMQESRAINSSLHVLERCLHTLRRKQTSKQDLVPYRESKLTRLLGTGLSGTRGEAVSMVVTLNPSPDYAHETRHVLQLAAVARDIQVNNTIAESVSTLESSCSQDTTIMSNAEVTRLRADNERLHYELVQAESLNRKLMEEMAEQQHENALTVKDLVEEARDITQQYYKSQLKSLSERHEAEITELREEYEAKLAKVVVADKGTPSRALQNKVMQLMKQIAILEEELNAERLTKARMREELLHLRACIEERDEKATEDNSNEEDAIQVTDSENSDDEDDDICNDSLEPTFKKEDINRSRLIRQSTLNNTRKTCDNEKNDTYKDDSLTDKDITDVTYDDSKRDSTITETDATYDVSSDTYNQSMDCPGTVKKVTDETYDVSNNDSCNKSIECPATVKKADVKNDDSISINKGKSSYLNNSNIEEHSTRGTYFVRNSYLSTNDNSEEKDVMQNSDSNFVDTGISVSLKHDEDSISINKGKASYLNNSNIEEHSTRGTYFVRNSYVSTNDNSEEKDVMQNSDSKFVDTGMSVSLKDDEDLKDYSIIDVEVIKPVKPIETQIDKIKKFAIGTVSTNSSLTQFEMLELEITESKKDLKSPFKYFEDGWMKKPECLNPKKKDKKLYFDDKQPSPDEISMVKDLIKKHDVLRSPSIVQDEIPDDYKPTTINQIMRESIIVTTDVPPLYKNKLLLKMHDSIDPFEEADSPNLIQQDILKNIEEARKSIARVSLADIAVEVNSELLTEIVENEKSTELKEKRETEVSDKMEMEHAAQSKEVDNAKLANTNVDVPLATQGNTSAVTIFESLCKKSESKKTDTDVRLDNVHEVKKEKMDAQNTDKVMEQELNETKENTSALTTHESNCKKSDSRKTNTCVKLDNLHVVKQEKMDTDNTDKVTEQDLKSEDLLHEITSVTDVTNSNEAIASENNTIDAFENIYKNITAPRATDFELLISDKTIDNASENATDKIEETKEKVNNNNEVRKLNRESKETKDTIKFNSSLEDNNNHEINVGYASVSKPIKYNLRHKTQNTSKTDNENEISIEHLEKCAPRTVKKSLRLKRKNKNEEKVEEEAKLKDIVNLQKEFSDVTLGVPAPIKVVKDIPSPEKSESENQPPLMGVQSCPSKSVTRSRRKLFTPRAEPLHESPPAGDSAERVRVPRPSYHRARTRRRLH